MKLIPLVNCTDQVIVDDDDYERMVQYKWKRQIWKRRPPQYVYCHFKRQRGIFSGPHLFHTVLLGKTPTGHVWDHINRDVLDNRRSNLRVVTYAVNAINKSVERESFSGWRGVRFDKRSRIRPWIAGLGLNGKEIWLGSFVTKEEAIVARQRGELKYYGELCPLPPGVEFKDWGGMEC